jgi:hypothetical protein
MHGHDTAYHAFKVGFGIQAAPAASGDADSPETALVRGCTLHRAAPVDAPGSGEPRSRSVSGVPVSSISHFIATLASITNVVTARRGPPAAGAWRGCAFARL